MSFVLSDVDGVILDSHGNLRQGAVDLLCGFAALGFEIVLWSGNGAEHARQAADRIGLPNVRCLSKPPFPIRLDAALALLGTVPALQLDDDPFEHVADWPFVHIHCEGEWNYRKIRPA